MNRPHPAPDSTPGFATAFGAWLDRPGPPFSGETRVRLDDVFTPPALTLHRQSGAVADPMATAQEARRLLVSGPQRVGRSTFAKRIVRASRASGEVPVYARGYLFHNDYRAGAVARRLLELAEEQYGRRVRPTVLVLDDLDRARLPGERGAEAVGRRNVLRAVEGQVERVVAFTVEHDLAARLNADGPLEYQAASLGSINASRRADLAARFVQAMAPAESWRAFVGPARRILEDLFGRGHLPSFPYYVLVALGELYTGDPAHIDGTGYGHYYEVVVHEAAQAARAHRGGDATSTASRPV